MSALAPLLHELSPPQSGWSVDPEWHDASAVAVLVLLDSNEPDLVLIRRAQTVRSHQGQVSFAGGRREISDTSPVATALRELQEELGLQPEGIQIIGQLPTQRALDGHWVVPIAMHTSTHRRRISPSPGEVDEVLIVPWYSLSPESANRFRFNIFGTWRESWLYTHNGHSIWGLTAQILARATMGAAASPG